MSAFDITLSIALGVALAAAVGLRVFLPLLVASIAAYSGHLSISHEFAWLATLPAIIMLSVAALFEVGAYYVPVIDNLLDAIAAPAALIAGVVIAAAVMVDVPPILKWTLAVIAGGGAAGAMQWLTTLLRAKSTALTGGLGNSALATAEVGGAAVVSLLAIFAPLLALILIVLACWMMVRVTRKLLGRQAAAKDAGATS